MNKDLHKVTSRLQRLKLKLLRYKLDLHYIPGKSMLIAELLSRFYMNDLVTDDETHSEMVHYLNTEVAISAESIKGFQLATKRFTFENSGLLQFGRLAQK